MSEDTKEVCGITFRRIFSGPRREGFSYDAGGGWTLELVRHDVPEPGARGGQREEWQAGVWYYVGPETVSVLDSRPKANTAEGAIQQLPVKMRHILEPLQKIKDTGTERPQ